MEQIILIVHLLLALAIIGLIMLQQGKGADMGASFGAGASQTLFGSDGSGNVLTKSTGWLVALFFASSFSLALIANQRSAAVDELDLQIPATEVVEEPSMVEQELPVVEDDLPTATAPAGSEGDIPELD
jgi:preprotein translocase subunit SecG